MFNSLKINLPLLIQIKKEVLKCVDLKVKLKQLTDFFLRPKGWKSGGNLTISMIFKK